MKKVLGILLNLLGLAAFLYCILGSITGVLQGALAVFGSLAVLCGTVLEALGGKKRPDRESAPSKPPRPDEKPVIVEDEE